MPLGNKEVRQRERQEEQLEERRLVPSLATRELAQQLALRLGPSAIGVSKRRQTSRLNNKPPSSQKPNSSKSRTHRLFREISARIQVVRSKPRHNRSVSS